MDDVFSSQSFADLGLADDVLKGIEQVGFEQPTHVQASLIPLALSGRDVLGQSKTGSGKTAAFGLPLLSMLDDDTHFAALCLVPTRELAIQVTHDIRALGRASRKRVVAIYGGQRMRVQREKLEKGQHIIVGTPGRVMDLHKRGALPYEHLKVVVLDEVDRMLDIGFRDDIRNILSLVKHKHQTIFVSATISPEIEKLARRFMTDPEKVELTASRSLTVEQVTQHYFMIEPWDKKRLLLHLLTHEKPGMALIFCRTKTTVDALCDYLRRKKVDAHAIHGDMYQGKRNRIMTKLRAGELNVLIASDLAARGLDVDDISHVINYDLPEDPEIYVHRIGRTARAGRDGVAWSFVTSEQGMMLTAIEKLTNVEIAQKEYQDFKPSAPPEARRARPAREGKDEAAAHTPVPTHLPTDSDAQDPTKFPGGVVPTAIPKRRMGGRIRTRRS